MKLKKTRNKYFYLFADCIPVIGAKRSIICDLGRQEVYFIPNSLYKILREIRKYKFNDVLKYLKISNYKIIEDYLTFLIDNELGIWMDDITQFPEIDMQWLSPNIISNAIIDIKNSNHNFESLFKQLNELGCQDLQIRFYQTTNYSTLDSLMNILQFSSIKSVEFYIEYNKNICDIKKLAEITKKHARITLICLHSAPKNKVIKHKHYVRIEEMGRIYFIKEILKSSNSCGQINPMSFSYKSAHNFSENIKFNGCLNRKISIDTNGEIKNCPSFKKGFGNLNEVSLKDVLSKKEFTNIWNINKDQIEVCKDCEFRYICTDCRAYIEKPNNIYSKPLKCGYNPYTNEWKEWSVNPLKQKTIENYGIQELIKSDITQTV